MLQSLPTLATIQDDITRTQWKLPYAAPPLRPRAPDLPEFKLGDTVAFTDKQLRERVGAILGIKTTSCSLLCDGEQSRMSPSILQKIIALQRSA